MQRGFKELRPERQSYEGHDEHERELPIVAKVSSGTKMCPKEDNMFDGIGLCSVEMNCPLASAAVMCIQ